MTKADKFRSMAVRVILKFTDGLYTLKKFSSESYNATTGVKEVVYDDLTGISMVSAAIVEEREIKDISSDKHFSIIAAGVHIEGHEPSPGDLVVTPKGETHKIAKVSTDMYGASYEMFVHKESWV